VGDVFKKRWFEDSIQRNPNTAYGDTDSLYFKAILDINKHDKPEAYLDACDTLGSDINKLYKSNLAKIVEMFNGDPEYNYMKFDHEVTSFLAIYVTKKHYAMYPNSKDGKREYKLDRTDVLKVMGSPAVKADASNIVKNMLAEVYKILLIKSKMNLKQMEFQIYHKIRNKFVKEINDAVGKFEIKIFSQIKKFPLNEKSSTFVKHALGMKWFNSFVNDEIRRGDACYMVDVVVDMGTTAKLTSQLENQDPLYGFNEQCLLPTRFTQIAVPVTFDDYDMVQAKLKEHRMVINKDQLIEFHVDKKLNLYRVLFN